ncbi:MAG: hypothetical protein Q7W51_02955 [Coriobacteriia bacterium]|nr:hypothetical protein [Coriobacteriia bacterium]
MTELDQSDPIVSDDNVRAAQVVERRSAAPGMGALIGIGAGLGMTLGIILGDMILGMLCGAGVGTVAGAIVEGQRRR